MDAGRDAQNSMDVRDLDVTVTVGAPRDERQAGKDRSASASSRASRNHGSLAASPRMRRGPHDMSTTRDELLTVDQVLDELGGLSRRTFFRWRELGRAPQCVKLPNGELRIWRSDLRAWLRLLQERTA
jgi:predicted DNA-binding transcriptional regulator AlpA